MNNISFSLDTMRNYLKRSINETLSDVFYTYIEEHKDLIDKLDLNTIYGTHQTITSGRYSNIPPYCRNILSATLLLAGVNILDKITFKITPYTFLELPITEIVIPNTIEIIGHNAFAGCKLLKRCYISKSVKGINSSAFEDCNSLKQLEYEGTKREWEYIKKFSNCLPPFCSEIKCSDGTIYMTTYK